MTAFPRVNFGTLQIGQTFKVLNVDSKSIHPRTPLMTKTAPVAVKPDPKGLNPSSRSAFHNIWYEIKPGSRHTAFFPDKTIVVPI